MFRNQSEYQVLLPQLECPIADGDEGIWVKRIPNEFDPDLPDTSALKWRDRFGQDMTIRTRPNRAHEIISDGTRALVLGSNEPVVTDGTIMALFDTAFMGQAYVGFAQSGVEFAAIAQDGIHLPAFATADLPDPSGINDGVIVMDTDLGALKVTSAGAWVLVSTAPSLVVADPGDAGAIDVTKSGVCDLVSEAAETRTLADPTFVGQQLLVNFDTDGGDVVLTAASVFDGTNNTITLSAAGQAIKFEARTVASALQWLMVGNYGTALSHV
jgi:hypothetical protein